MGPFFLFLSQAPLTSLVTCVLTQNTPVSSVTVDVLFTVPRTEAMFATCETCAIIRNVLMLAMTIDDLALAIARRSKI